LKFDVLYPRRALSGYTTIFDEKDFYHIDEVMRMGKEGLEGPEFRMSVGNAAFLVDEVEKEIKRVDRANGKSKRPRLSR